LRFGGKNEGVETQQCQEVGGVLGLWLALSFLQKKALVIYVIT
jgi:hypothetical protein